MSWDPALSPGPRRASLTGADPHPADGSMSPGARRFPRHQSGELSFDLHYSTPSRVATTPTQRRRSFDGPASGGGGGDAVVERLHNPPKMVSQRAQAVEIGARVVVDGKHSGHLRFATPLRLFP